MQSKISERMGFLTVLLAGMFLWNPISGFSDLLPDLFGYLLFWFGLSLLADLNDSVGEARKRFGYLIGVGVGELLIRYLLRDAASRQVSDYQQPTWILLFSFALLVLQWWLLIPAFKKLFAGIDRLADKYGNERLSKTKHNRTQSERMSRMATVFVAVHSIFAVLPELAILTSFEYRANNENFGFDWYEYIGLFRTVGMGVSLIFGLIWLIAFVCYTVRILRDREWLGQLRLAYINEILPQEGMLKARRLCAVLSILSVGVFFTANLRIDGQVALSGVVLAAAVLTAIFLAGELLEARSSYRASCVVLLIVGAANALTRYAYLQRFDVESSKYQTDAFWFFFATQVLEIFEVAMTLLVIWKTLGLLLSLSRAHTVVDYRTPGSEEISKNATARLHRSFEKRAKIVFAVFTLAAVGYAFEAVLRLKFDWLWVIPFGVSMVGIFLFLGLVYELTTQIRWKYLSDATHNRL